MFYACPGLLLAVDSATGPFSLHITRRNAERL
jgi:hypothetical protein